MTEKGTQQGLATQVLITPECRRNRGDGGAFEEAVRRLREEYDAVCRGWAEADEQPSMQLVLYLHRPVEIATPAIPRSLAESQEGER